MDNQELQSTSPVVKVEVKPLVTYLFSDALREVLNGGKITRIAWENPNIYGTMKDRLLYINGTEDDNLLHPWTLSEGDMVADDWVVL